MLSILIGQLVVNDRECRRTRERRERCKDWYAAIGRKSSEKS